MTLKSIILGGAAAVALTCGGFVASSFAQTQQAPADQSAPAASSQATPDTQAAPSDKAAASDTSSAPTKHVKHHRRMARKGGSTKEERAETQKLNQDQLAKAQGASQGQYGTMQQPSDQSTTTPQNSSSSSSMPSSQPAPGSEGTKGQYGTEQTAQPGSEPGNMNNAPAPSTSNTTGGPNTAAPSDTAQPSSSTPNTNTPPSNSPKAPNPSSPPQK